MNKVIPDNLIFETNFVVFPTDTNYNMPQIFGGALASQMDICAAMTVRRALYDSPTCVDAVTVNMGGPKGPGLNFHHEAKMKDLIFLRGEIVRFGIKSIEIDVSGEVEDQAGNRFKLCTGKFIFVSRNENHVPTPHNLKLPGEESDGT